MIPDDLLAILKEIAEYGYEDEYSPEYDLHEWLVGNEIIPPPPPPPRPKRPSEMTPTERTMHEWMKWSAERMAESMTKRPVLFGDVDTEQQRTFSVMPVELWIKPDTEEDA